MAHVADNPDEWQGEWYDDAEAVTVEMRGVSPAADAIRDARAINDLAVKLYPPVTPSGIDDTVPRKFDDAKARLELVPPEWTIGVAKVLTFGAKKYAAGNWSVGKGFDWSRLIGAAERHIAAWKMGEDIDPESGLSHLYHAGCMLAFLSAHVERNKGVDDRVAIGVRHNAQRATKGAV